MSSAVAAPSRQAFDFLSSRHAFSPRLNAFRGLIEERSQQDGRTGRVEVSAEIKGVRTPHGWALDRFYWSLLRWPAGSDPVGFAASTLYWAAEDGAAKWFDLADEPYLRGLQAWLRYAGEPHSSVEVLRYVPLRRFTFRAGPVIGKFKRPSVLYSSYDRAQALTTAAAGSSLHLPALCGVDDTLGVYYQRAVDGIPLSDLLRVGDAAALFTEAGRVIADLHALPAAGLPRTSIDDVARGAVQAADWTAALRPELASRLADVRDVLVATRPAPNPAYDGTCHGDIVPSHLLSTAAGWSVIDLDLAHRGDVHRDLAYFLAALPGDVPLLAESVAPVRLRATVERAFLTGYEAGAARSVDSRRLMWHRAAAELHHLAVMHSKDRVRPGSVATGLDRLDVLADALAAGSVRAW